MKKKAIYFFTEEVSFILREKNKIRKWILYIIVLEDFRIGSLNYIFCSDIFLHKANLQYLQHDTYTDILTFDTSDESNEISGDIFVSIERVKENARTFKVLFKTELYRIMVHGILHLLGYNDKTQEEKELMKSKEDYYLSLLPKFIQ